MYKHKYEQNKSNDQVYHFVLKYKHKILYIHLYSPSCNRQLDYKELIKYYNLLQMVEALDSRLRKIAGSSRGCSAFKQQPSASCSYACASVDKQCNLAPVKKR